MTYNVAQIVRQAYLVQLVAEKVTKCSVNLTQQAAFLNSIIHEKNMRGSRKFCQRGSNFDNVSFLIYERI